MNIPRKNYVLYINHSLDVEIILDIIILIRRLIFIMRHLLLIIIIIFVDNGPSDEYHVSYCPVLSLLNKISIKRE